jgi:hypothetical protein
MSFKSAMRLVLKTQQVIKRYLLANGVYMSRVTPYSDLVAFLASLKPIKTNYELIRLGGDADGGYLVPNDLTGIEACFSPGVATTADFENDLTAKGIKCFLADFSVDSPPIDNPLFDFEKKFLGIENDETFTTLESWVNRKAPNKGDLLLQMDIEGAEYPVIFHTSEEALSKFRVIVIEFHDLETIFTRKGYELVRLCFSKLLKSFNVVHIHPNNYCGAANYKDLVVPRVMEFTFLRKDRITHRAPYKNFPNPLDRKNVANNPDIHLPACWY